MRTRRKPKAAGGTQKDPNVKEASDTATTTLTEKRHEYMASNNRTVLVTGATGKQGGSVVRHMLGKGWDLKALTRDAKSKAAKALLDKGVEVVQGDMEDASSLDGAFLGVYGVFS